MLSERPRDLSHIMRIDFNHFGLKAVWKSLWILETRSENGYEFRGQACKKVPKNYILWSGIGSGVCRTETHIPTETLHGVPAFPLLPTTGWLGFRDLASPLFSLQTFRCVHMRRRASSVTEISVTELEMFPIWAFCTFFISITGIKFPIWTEDKIRSAYRAHMKRPLEVRV